MKTVQSYPRRSTVLVQNLRVGDVISIERLTGYDLSVKAIEKKEDTFEGKPYDYYAVTFSDGKIDHFLPFVTFRHYPSLNHQA